MRRTREGGDVPVEGDEEKSGRYSLSMYVLMPPYWGLVKRWLIRAVANDGGEAVASWILNAAESAGSEVLRALAILREVVEPILVSRLDCFKCQLQQTTWMKACV